jgi:hypothetical protein
MLSCSSDDLETVVPSTILSEEKFTKIIVDFALAESTGNINVKNVASDKMDSVYAFNPLIENNVTKGQYDSAIAFYSKHPNLYKKIYENVLAELSKMQIKKDSLTVDPASKR